MNVSLRQLKAFLGVAESGNFTKTAQRLHLSQAALSATIRELESQLRSRLFDRTTRAVELTEAGRAFLPTAALIVREMEAGTLRVRELERKDVSRISVGFTPLMASQVLPEVIERFAVVAPTVSVDVVDAPPPDIQQLVEAGSVDAGYGAFFSKASGLRQQAILPSRLLVACALARPLPEPLSWKDLGAHALIALQPWSPIEQLADERLRDEQVEPVRLWRVNHLETAIALAEKDFGVTVIPSFAAAACRRYAVRLQPILPAVEFDFCQITRAGRETPPAIDAFAKVFAEVAESFASMLPSTA
jgi:DNA-binding transcriptional LysR family regulator